MQIVRSGVDSLYFAVNGILPEHMVEKLARAKAEAIEQRRQIAIEFGETKVGALVYPHGHQGGYEFVFDTGPLGARFACRESSNRKADWNFFVKPHATAFLTLGFGPVVRNSIDTLIDLGGEVLDISLNRIDYATDIRADDFTLDLARFIGHPRAKRRAYWGLTDEYHPSAVVAGRNLQSVTVGRPTGWEVIVYDKTAEAYARSKLHWFEAWRLDPSDKVARIWRVELRLCRNEIKNVQRLRSFADLEFGLCRALCSLMQRVRYVAAGEVDTNVTRRRSDPLWTIARQHIESTDLLGGTGDLPPSRLIEISRDMQIACHTKLITGNAASLAAAMSLDENAIRHCLSDIVGSAIDAAVPTDSFQRSFSRAQMRQRVVHNDL